MKLTFLVYTEVYASRIMDALHSAGIDYYTLWEHVKGKGHGTEAHLGTRSFPGINSVMMIAIQEEEQLQQLVGAVERLNGLISLPDDRVRLFEVPLASII
jgi:hypothetical protein